MHFSHTHEGSGSKATKIAIVAALHLAVGAALIKNMNTKTFSVPKMIEEIAVFIPEAPKPPPPPPEPPKPKAAAVKPPEVYAPPPEVPVQQPPPEPTVQASAQPDPAPAAPGPVAPAAPPAEPGNGTMRSAVLADANGCAKPDYPAKAAREGVTGTVTLALLVDANGGVSSSRVQRSSGSRELDRAAQAALSLCKFKPAMEGGSATSGWAQIAYVWTLD